jgi:glycosyltransferase involved in cell wall biosynthesis
VTSGIAFNGKFLSASPTGVHRVAAELTTHVDRQLTDYANGSFAGTWDVICPKDRKYALDLKNMRCWSAGVFTWQPWEQFDLPTLARGKVLVNLCNLAPLLHRHSITMIHDAQVFTTPQSYGRAFRNWYRFALPRIGATAARILTVSEFSKSQLVKVGIADPGKIQVIHNGVDHMKTIVSSRDAVIRLGLTRNKYVVALASTQDHKNISVLLKAFALTTMSGFKLVLVGRAREPEFRAAGMRPPNNTIFAGYVTDGEMRGLMEEAACFALPSTTEGFGLPPVEAMAVGCAAVVAPCGALPEVCGSAAVYVDATDVEGWGQAMKTFAEDGIARQAAINKGLEHVKDLTWHQAASTLLGTIYEVAKEAS